MSRGPSLGARYSALLRGTGAAQPLVAGLVGRLSLGTTGLALLLLTRDVTGSYAAAGAVAAAYAVSLAGFAPVRARRADRSGPRGVLLVCGIAHPLVLVALVGLAALDAGAAALVAAALLAGATVPPLGGVLRAMWGALVGEELLPTAYSLEAVVIEVCFVAGPLVVAGLTAVAGPSAAVLASAALVLVGTLWLTTTPALRAVVPHERSRPRGSGPLSSAGVRVLLVTVALVDAGFGALEVAMPAYVEERGAAPGAAGVLLAVWSAGSIAGGLAYGARPPTLPHTRQMPWLVAAFAVGGALPLLASGTVDMGLLLVGYGLTIAPFTTCNSILLGRAAPPGALTETFAWSGSMIFGGAALGSVASGLAVEQVGATGGLALTAAAGAGALLGSLAGRRTLGRLPAPAGVPAPRRLDHA